MQIMVNFLFLFTLFFSLQLSFAQYWNKNKPTENQYNFNQLKYGMFIHFGINTYNDMEWSYGDLPLSSFKLDSVYCDQWVQTAKKAGMKYIIFTTKHVDGFCNWHTRFTEYSIVNTPYKKDLLKQLAEACRRHGMKLGLYYCLWDTNNKDHVKNEARYNEFVRNQVTELLTNYGDVVCLWFDGFWKNQKSGWKSQNTTIDGEVIEKNNLEKRNEIFMNAWRNEGAYRLEWDQLYLLIKKLQPNCLVMNNPTTAFLGLPLMPVDVRAAEKGYKLEKNDSIWNWLGDSTYIPLEIEMTLSQKGTKLFPSGNWFWHEWDNSVASIELVNEWVEKAKKLRSNLVLNVGPKSNGKLRDEDIQLLEKLNLK